LLASFVERSRRLERDLMARCAAVAAEEAARIAAVRERRIELRRLELLEERAVQQERVAAARRQRRELDEFVASKRAVR
jgi:flagellar biosynthesis chaperone FliJ